LIVAEERNGERHHPDIAAATVVVRLRPLTVPDMFGFIAILYRRSKIVGKKQAGRDVALTEIGEPFFIPNNPLTNKR
jgi:hypothetical protein